MTTIVASRTWIKHPLVIIALFWLIMPYVLRFFGATYLLSTEILIFIIFALGFNILMGYTGITSFGHGAYLGIAAYAAALTQLHVVKSMAIPIVVGIVAATLVGLAVGALIIRKRGIYFALLTLAFGQLFFIIVFRWTEVTGGENGLGGIKRLPLNLGIVSLDLNNQLVFYYVIYIFAALCMYVIWRLLRSPFGKILLAIRENDLRASTVGYSTRKYKLAAFVISTFFAGVAGSLYVFLLNFIYAETLHWLSSGNVVMMSLVGGMRNFFGPILGAAVFIFFRDSLSSFTEHWMFFFGAIFIIFIMFSPQGICGILDRMGLRLFGEALGKESVDLSRINRVNANPGPPAAQPRANNPGDEVILSTKGLVKSFGALVAVNNVDLTVRRGEIRSIIGPNGAGKTTLFNCITGMIEVDHGQIDLKGKPITGFSPSQMVHLGIARSFQIISLFNELTAFENVRIAVLAKTPHRWNTMSDTNALFDVTQKTWETLQEVGLSGRENLIAGEMSHGEQRLLEVGITLAGDPEILMLDEPFAGLSTSEKDQIANLLRRLAKRYTIILIEHDIDKVLALSDRITVMHQGRIIADGTPAEIQTSEEVKKAYLGAKEELEKLGKAPRKLVARPSETSKVQLSVQGINTFYGQSHILHDVSMEVRHGEVVSLLGRNGMGKTTLLRSIIGATPPRRGEIIFKGEKLTGLPTHLIAQRGIGIVPEDRRIFPNLTLIDNLRIAHRGKNGGAWDMERVFRHFPRLQELRYSKGENLSGGEQQMLTIARTLMGNVDLLLLDEPFEGLAPAIIMEIRNIIETIKEELTIIIVEQNVDLSLSLSDRAYILDVGRMVYQGEARDLQENHALRTRYLAV